MSEKETTNFDELKEIINITIEFTFANRFNRQHKNTDAQVNNYLKSGWKLLALLPKPSGKIQVDVYDSSEITYSLGWFGSEDAPHFELEVYSYEDQINEWKEKYGDDWDEPL